MNESPEDKQSPLEHQLGKLSDEELNEALSTLEHILRHRHVVVPEPEDEGAAAADDPENLPLLKNVVVPGDPPTPLPREPDEEPEHAPYDDSLEPAPHHDDLVVRLVNELDIIIESCVDDALAAAKQELMVKMKTHLDIVLPEILEELERRRFDPEEGDGTD